LFFKLILIIATHKFENWVIYFPLFGTDKSHRKDKELPARRFCDSL
jgi:hypothetical protein